MMTTWNASVNLWIESCIMCKTSFGMSNEVYRIAQDRKGEFAFYCPNGHGQVYTKGDSEETKLRRERDRLKQEHARLHDALREAEDAKAAESRRASALKGVATRLKNNAALGICPCCGKKFVNLAQHMKGKHPELVETDVETLDAADPQKVTE